MKKAKVIWWIVAALVICLIAMLCVDYFVLQHPLFDRSGWHITDAGQVQFRDYYARPLTHWQTIEGKQYYFGEDGSRYSGWLDTEKGRCYLDSNGVLQSGWLELEGKRYYTDEKGILQTGWLEQEKGKVYLDEDGSLHTGWLELPEGKYLLDSEGYPRTGWLEDEGLRYYFREDGSLNESWQDSPEGLSYLTDGNPHIGWLDVPEGKFYFNEDGKAHTGWVTDETGRFYLYGDGTFATGFVEVDGIERYFTASGEYVLLCNRWNPVPEDFEMNLVSIGKFKIDASCSDALQQMLDDGKEDGFNITINNTYRSKATQENMWKVRQEKYMGQGMTLAEADAYIGRSVAVPGTSEHQTGLALDVNKTQKNYKWLADNSWKYGFILRYPDDKIDITGIIYEPWHFRYVGKAFAKEVYDSGLCLEEYLEALKNQ